MIEKYQDYIDRGSDRRSDIACLDFLKNIKGKLISGKGAVYQVEIPDDEYLMIWEIVFLEKLQEIQNTFRIA